MAEVFISYSSQHRALTERLAAVIEAARGPGSVWYDKEISSGEQFRPEITAALDAARAVVVVWTAGAVESTWVYAEAVRAAAARKIVTVREASLAPERIPLPFNVYHTDPIDDAGEGHAALIAAIARRIEGKEAAPLPADLPGAGFRGFLLDPRQEALPARATARRPASLLVARHRLVEYDDIHAIREEMVTWATTTPAHAMGSPVLGRLVHGPGGLGKTRALIEVAETLTREHGWLAGFVPRGVREEARTAMESLIARGGGAAGLLLVLDYAEGRQEDATWLAERLVKRAETVSAPARLVMLSRGAGDWWGELVRKSQALQELTSLGGDLYDVKAIPEEIGRGDRIALFDRAVEAFVALRTAHEQTAPDLPPVSDALARDIETEADYDRPLAVQMAALLYAMGHDAAERRDGMAGLLERILGLEYEHWDKALKLTADDTNARRALKRGVALATLLQGVPDGAAARALVAADPEIGGMKDLDTPRAVDFLTRLYPGGDGGLLSLEPDLVGERHVAEVADAVLVDVALAAAGDDAEKRQAVLTVLNRATRAEHGAHAAGPERLLADLVARRGATLGPDLVTVAVETPGKLLSLVPALEPQVAGFDGPTLAAIYRAIPHQTQALLDLALAIAERRATEARLILKRIGTPPGLFDTTAADRELLAIHRFARQCLDDLGFRLGQAGRPEEAEAATTEAVALWRILVAACPAVYDPDLAYSLNNLANWRAALGRFEDALTATQESVDLLRPLAVARPDVYSPGLARGLGDLGNWLSQMGSFEEALSATRESVNIRRRLAASDPEAHQADLARSLANLGNLLHSFGCPKSALTATREAAGLYRLLAKARPDAHLKELSGTLSNLGLQHAALGQAREAVAVTLEALAILENLADAHPDVHAPGVAGSHGNLSLILYGIGEHKVALIENGEGVQLYRTLAAQRPDAHTPDLARSLGARSMILAALGRPAEAAASAAEGLRLLLPYLARLPQALGTLAQGLGREYLAAVSAAGLDIDHDLMGDLGRAIDPDMAAGAKAVGLSDD